MTVSDALFQQFRIYSRVRFHRNNCFQLRRRVSACRVSDTFKKIHSLINDQNSLTMTY